jgi:hypothetical protein
MGRALNNSLCGPKQTPTLFEFRFLTCAMG